MVSEAEAKEIAGRHVDRIVGGPEAGYRVRESTSYGPEGPVDVEVEVWRVADEVDDPAVYGVEVDREGEITSSGWESSTHD
ncbi:MAG: hypothetical protein ABEJ81_02725 [Haloferacaceae archaeon]